MAKGYRAVPLRARLHHTVDAQSSSTGDSEGKHRIYVYDLGHAPDQRRGYIVVETEPEAV